MSTTQKSAPKKTISKKTGRAKKAKVPAASHKVTVIKLHCPNCGEEEERILYCDSCDSPMNVISITERDEDDVQTDIAVSNVKKEVAEDEDEDGGGTGDAALDEEVAEGGVKLDDIFPSGEGNEDGLDNPDAGFDDMDKVVDILDQEE